MVVTRAQDACHFIVVRGRRVLGVCCPVVKLSAWSLRLKIFDFLLFIQKCPSLPGLRQYCVSLHWSCRGKDIVRSVRDLYYYYSNRKNFSNGFNLKVIFGKDV